MVKKRKTMPRRSNSARSMLMKGDSTDDEPPFPRFLYGMPPWYVRAFLYGVMLLCFSMVFFMDAPSHHQPSAPQVQVVNHQKSMYDQSIIDQNCRKSESNPPFFYCGTRSIDKLNRDQNLQMIMDKLKESMGKAKDDKKWEVGFIDIGAKDGGYLALHAATTGSRVFVAGGGEVELQQVKFGIQANNVVGRVIIVEADQREISERLEKEIGSIDFFDVVMRVDMDGPECTIFERTDHLLSSIKISHIFMPWRADLDTKHHGCVIIMLSKMISHKFQPTQLEGPLLDASEWRSWPDGYIVWVKQ